MTSVVGWFALLLFIPLSLRVMREQPRALVVSVVVLLGSLFLPEYTVLLDPPFVPGFEKERLTYLCALLGLFVYHRAAWKEAKPGTGLEMWWVLILAASLFTWSANRQAVVDNGTLVPGLTSYWVLANGVDDFLAYAVPFLVGRIAFRSVADLRLLAFCIVGAGLLYVPILAIEALLSIPFSVWQFHFVVYGISLQPQVRWGGVQPIGFMESPLATASFLVMAVVLAAALARSEPATTWMRVRRAHLWTQVGLLLTRVSSLNIYGLTFGLAFRFFGAYLLARVAVLVAVFMCAYPAARMADVFPDDVLVTLAREWINEERARSFEGRFVEEDMIFEVAGERLWVGWGQFDRIPGASIIATTDLSLDSYLVQRVGLSGLLGWELTMMLALFPMLVAWSRMRSLPDDRSRIIVAGVMACIAIRLLDFLMNGLWNYFPFFLAGALSGAIAATKVTGAARRRDR